jgi:hypothetical protein
MAALYLHNALIPESEHHIHGHSLHSRTMSTGTLKTYTTTASQPTEPLLFSSSVDSAAYKDILTRQPLHPSGRRATWQTALSLEGDPASFLERKGFWEKNVRRRLRVLKFLKVSMEGIMSEADSFYHSN